MARVMTAVEPIVLAQRGPSLADRVLFGELDSHVPCAGGVGEGGLGAQLLGALAGAVVGSRPVHRRSALEMSGPPCP
ncbi:hypothetical protein AQJ91_45055 [Streptomyces dysideae]|uniref:Uncharacterized protein n=1 Tax=Streptomyces dysideae TaxID=909626 RepID=A0A117RXD4_9ACTN|nr:hypothetical protein AQJ91_45055 [Streptomyces dysideae]